MKYVRPKPRTKYPGVYAVEHKASGTMYVGASNDMTGRWTHHRFTLRRGTHKTVALQALWTQDGEGAFCFRVLERCVKADLLAREQHWLDNTPASLNTSPTAVTGFSSKPSERRKAAAVERWKRPAYRAKQAAVTASKIADAQPALLEK